MDFQDSDLSGELRELLEQVDERLFAACRDAQRRTCASAFALPIPGTIPQQFVAVGTAEEIEQVLRMATAN